MMLRHRLKRAARDLYSRLLFHTGLWRWVDRLSERRLLILAGHCVDAREHNGDLPADMKIGPERLERLLRVLARRFQLVTVGEGVRALESPPTAGRELSMVALSMDDGYKDNRTALLPLLERVDGRCTVFLEARPLAERRLGWLHKWFWALNRRGAHELGRAYAERSEEPATIERLGQLLAAPGEDLAYQLKRVLKYEAPAADRDRVVDELFVGAGGREADLCQRIYMDLEDVRSLQESGRFELGGHTDTHEVLANLDDDAAESELRRGRGVLAELLGEDCGHTFAYPFGRRWDFKDRDARLAREVGYQAAVTTHAAANRRGGDAMRLGRWMIDDSTPLHLLVTEACGGFELLRRCGLDLVE